MQRPSSSEFTTVLYGQTWQDRQCNGGKKGDVAIIDKRRTSSSLRQVSIIAMSPFFPPTSPFPPPCQCPFLVECLAFVPWSDDCR
jgi:hypothetical protein